MRPQLVKSRNPWGPIFVTWSLCLRWSVALLVSTMGKPSIKLRLNPKWLVTTWLSSQSLTSLLSMEGLVLVLLIPQGLFLSSENCHQFPTPFAFTWTIVCFTGTILIFDVYFIVLTSRISYQSFGFELYLLMSFKTSILWFIALLFFYHNKLQ